MHGAHQKTIAVFTPESSLDRRSGKGLLADWQETYPEATQSSQMGGM